MNALVGGMPDAARFVVAFAVALGLFAAAVLIWRRFGSGVLMTTTGSRGRQPRLAVIDAAQVDARRRLVLIRRDNTEHLLMIGGPTDIVVESSIIRGGVNAGSREARPLPTGDLPARPEGPLWSPLGEISRPPRMTEAVDPMRVEPITARTELLRSETVRADSLRSEVVRPEPTRADSVVPEVAEGEDDIGHEQSRPDTVGQEALRLELRQESTRREASRQEAAKEKVRHEASRRERSTLEPVPLEPVRPARERVASEPTRLSRTETALRSSAQAGVTGQDRPEHDRADFAEELTRAMGFDDEALHPAEAPEPTRLAPIVQPASRTAILTTTEVPANPEGRRAAAGPSMAAAPPPVAPPVNATQETDFQPTAQPQRVPPPASPKEGAFQPTGVIRESPQPRPMAPRPSQADEHNLAEMAQRLEVALRRPTRPADAPAAPTRPAAGRIEPSAAPARPAAAAPMTSVVPAPRVAATVESSTASPTPGGRAPQPTSVSDLRADVRMRPVPEASAPFESLEEEMANLLGRAGKT